MNTVTATTVGARRATSSAIPTTHLTVFVSWQHQVQPWRPQRCPQKRTHVFEANTNVIRCGASAWKVAQASRKALCRMSTAKATTASAILATYSVTQTSQTALAYLTICVLPPQRPLLRQQRQPLVQQKHQLQVRVQHPLIHQPPDLQLLQSQCKQLLLHGCPLQLPPPHQHLHTHTPLGVMSAM